MTKCTGLEQVKVKSLTDYQQTQVYVKNNWHMQLCVLPTSHDGGLVLRPEQHVNTVNISSDP